MPSLEKIMGFDLGGILKQYLGGGSAQPVGDPADHFHEVAQNAPPQVVRDGLSQAFRSDQTPPFGQMVGDLFRQANPQQQAGMLRSVDRHRRRRAVAVQRQPELQLTPKVLRVAPMICIAFLNDRAIASARWPVAIASEIPIVSTGRKTKRSDPVRAGSA